MLMKSILLVAGLLSAGTSFAGFIPSVVPQVDAASFLGRWYEVASTQPSFQRDCVCVTADYGSLDAKTLSVVNTCRKETIDGALNVVEGTAETTRNSAKLKVSFGGFKFPFSNYWIVDLAEDYRYAVISTIFRSPIWILSRTPELSSEDLDGIYARLDENGYKVNKIIPTLQAACTYTTAP